MKNISTINPAMTGSTEKWIVKKHAPFIDLKVGMSLDPLCFNLLIAL